jgi:hypothetical protein
MEIAADKIRDYRDDYENSPSNSIISCLLLRPPLTDFTVRLYAFCFCRNIGNLMFLINLNYSVHDPFLSVISSKKTTQLSSSVPTRVVGLIFCYRYLPNDILVHFILSDTPSFFFRDTVSKIKREPNPKRW